MLPKLSHIFQKNTEKNKEFNVINKLPLRHLTFFLSLCFFLNLHAAPKEVALEIILGIDKIVKLDFSPHVNIEIGDTKVLDYKVAPQKREIIFKGLTAGRTSATIRNTVGDIKVVYTTTVKSTDQSKVIQTLNEFLGDVEGLEIGLKGETVYVGGNIVVPSDIGKVVLILEKYPDVIRLVELSPHTQRVIAKKMQDEIQKNNMKDVTVRVINGSFWLEGIVSSEGSKIRAMDIANAFIPDHIESLARRLDAVKSVNKPIIQNFINVNEKKKPAPTPKLIKISAQFVELTKDYNKVFGFKWEPTLGGTGGEIRFGKTVGGGGLTTRSDGTLAGVISNLFPKLASAKSAGYARVIQSGSVITKERVQAKLQKSTEKPFAIGTGEFTKPQKSTAGFNLTIQPAILEGEKIDMTIGLSVKSSVGDPPETTDNNISTALVVKSKESAVVGGIVINKSATDFDRKPPFGEDQVENGNRLFSFLRSKTYASSRSQFVVFVTPEIIESASTGTDKIKQKFRRRRR